MVVLTVINICKFNLIISELWDRFSSNLAKTVLFANILANFAVQNKPLLLVLILSFEGHYHLTGVVGPHGALWKKMSLSCLIKCFPLNLLSTSITYFIFSANRNKSHYIRNIYTFKKGWSVQDCGRGGGLDDRYGLSAVEISLPLTLKIG